MAITAADLKMLGSTTHLIRVDKGTRGRAGLTLAGCNCAKAKMCVIVGIWKTLITIQNWADPLLENFE